MNTIALRTIALTISPPTRVKVSKKIGLNPDELIERYDKDTRIIQRAVNRCSNDYVIYPEFDDKGRLHYHGTIKVRSNVALKLETMPILTEQLGFCMIKENPDDKWKDYMMKEWLETQEILKIEDPIKFTDLRKIRKAPPKPVKTLPRMDMDYMLPSVKLIKSSYDDDFLKENALTLF